ncbi:uncharacterized protein LOC135104714 [Scylla paramamosain]|uniref:uncharacterized protein LOC135104714 n=1 Tax=Scylla paramamosain TaxID=85552 RepID=UPI003082CDF3
MLPSVRFPWITPLITTGHECQGDTTLHHPTCCLYHTWEHHLEYQLSRYSPQPSQPILPSPVPTSTRPSSLKVCGSCQEQQEPSPWSPSQPPLPGAHNSIQPDTSRNSHQAIICFVYIIQFEYNSCFLYLEM